MNIPDERQKYKGIVVCAAGPARIHGQTVSMSLVGPNVKLTGPLRRAEFGLGFYSPNASPPQWAG